MFYKNKAFKKLGLLNCVLYFSFKLDKASMKRSGFFGSFQLPIAKKRILFDDDLFNYNFASLCWSSIPLFWCMPWSPFFKHENTCIRFYPRCGLRCRHWLYQSLLWMLIYILTRESSFHTRYKAKTILC